MSLDAAKTRVWKKIESEKNFPLWLEQPASSILSHDRDCCDEARLWFLSYARSMEIRSQSSFHLKAPVWLSELFTWGPSEWPIFWCELVEEEILDCGVLAALAREVFAAQGNLVHPAQAILQYNSDCTRHWREYWKAEDSGKKERKKKGSEKEFFPWIGEELVYH